MKPADEIAAQNDWSYELALKAMEYGYTVQEDVWWICKTCGDTELGEVMPDDHVHRVRA